MPDGPGPKLLAGGNPQIPKGDGDAPVQAYIEAMPEWKGVIARQLDDLVERVVPTVRKAVRWNSPFYGVEGRGTVRFGRLRGLCRADRRAVGGGAPERGACPGS